MRVRSATSGWRRDGWRRWSWAYRGPAEELDRLGGGETEREVDDHGEQIEFDQMSFPVRRHRHRRHEVEQASAGHRQQQQAEARQQAVPEKRRHRLDEIWI